MAFSFLDIFFPHPEICVICDAALPEMGYCSSCRETYARKARLHGQCQRCGTFGVRAKACDVCRDWPNYILGNRSLWPYDGEVRDAIAKFKYRKEPWRAHAFGRLLAEALPAEIQTLIPVPMDRQRINERGYNQATLLCREMAKERELLVLERALVRIEGRAHQVGSSWNARRENIKGAFQPGLDYDRIEGPVLLVDDVLTSGATLVECIKILHKGHPMQFQALTLASGLH